MRQADSPKPRSTRRSKTEKAVVETAEVLGESASLADEIPDDGIDDAVLRLAEERLKVGKRVVETGRVRVRRTTTEKVQKVDVPLSSDTYEVTRVPIGKEVTKSPPVRETRTEIIIPVVEEVLVVERRLVLREELHIRKVRSVERHAEEFTLRVQKATVERVAPENSDGGSSQSARSERPSRTGRSAKQPAQPRKRRSQ